MHPSRALLAIDELAKWKERKRRVEERLRQVRSRKRFLRRDLELAQAKISELTGLLRLPSEPVATAPIPTTPLGVIR